MRIGFMGGSGVGKTTLMEAMARSAPFAEYRFNRNVMARLRGRGFPINEHTTAETQTAAMKEFAYDLASCANAVNERTVLDCLAYTRTALRLGRLTRDEDADHTEAAMRLAPLYDRIFFIEPEFEVRENGLRLTEPKTYAAHIEMFRQVRAEAEPVAQITQVTGTVSARLRQIEESLDLRRGSLPERS